MAVHPGGVELGISVCLAESGGIMSALAAIGGVVGRTARG